MASQQETNLQPSFEDIRKARALLHESQMKAFGHHHDADEARIQRAARDAVEEAQAAEDLAHKGHKGLDVTVKQRPDDDESVASSVRALSPMEHQQGPTHQPKVSKVSKVLGRLVAPFVAHAVGSGSDAPTSGPPPASVEKPGFPKPEPLEAGDRSEGQLHEQVMGQHHAKKILDDLPDAMSRVGEAVGGGIQYVVHKTADTVHNATHLYDEGRQYPERPVPQANKDGMPDVPRGAIYAPGSEMSSLRKETLNAMQAEDNIIKSKDTLADVVTYPFCKDANDPTRAIMIAKSYYDYIDEKKAEAEKDFPGAKEADLAPGSMPNAITAAVPRAEHTHLRTHPVHPSPRAQLDSPEAAVNMEGGLPTKGLNDAANTAAMGYEPKAGGGAGAFAAAGTEGAAGANGIVGSPLAIHSSRDAATQREGPTQQPEHVPANKPNPEDYMPTKPDNTNRNQDRIYTDWDPSVQPDKARTVGTHEKRDLGATGGVGNLGGSRDSKEAAGEKPREEQDAVSAIKETVAETTEAVSSMVSGLASKFESLFTGGRDSSAREPAGEGGYSVGEDRVGLGDLTEDVPHKNKTTVGERLEDVGGYGRGADEVLDGSVASVGPAIPVVPFTSTEEMLRARQE